MIYLDHAASSPLLGILREQIGTYFDCPANPSATHALGRLARHQIEETRQKTADLFHIPMEQLLFTSGGSEANSLAIKSLCSATDKVLLSPMEHSSVSRSLESQTKNSQLIPWKQLSPDLEQLEKNLRNQKITLVSMMAVNNEIGLITPVEAVGQLIKRVSPSTFFHVDGVQAMGKIPLHLRRAAIDYFTFSGHKIGAMKGLGGLAMSERGKGMLRPLIPGGGQEMGLRSGTENLPAIASFGDVVSWWKNHGESQRQEWKKLQLLLQEGIGEIPGVESLAFTSSKEKNPTWCEWITAIVMPGFEAPSVIVRALGEAGIAVSSGSACSAGRTAENRILKALGFPENWRRGMVRVSFGWSTTKSEILQFVETFEKILRQYQ